MNKPLLSEKDCRFHRGLFTKNALLMGLFLFSAVVFAQSKKETEANSNESLLNQYVKSKGNAVIVFDSSNIKQFWIDKTVVSRNHSIDILLEGNKTNESVPLKIQLANVSESQDCRIDVISDESGLEFSVLNDQSKKISSSKKEDDFLNYSIASGVFHLEDTAGHAFYLVFNSKKTESISIKKIILSFSDNKNSNFLNSPGVIKYTGAFIEPSPSFKISNTNDNSFSVTGKRSIIFSAKKIYTRDNTISRSIKIKNTGDAPATVYICYAAYTKDGIKLFACNYPYKKTSKTMSVISSSNGSNKIIVDSYSDWAKGCILAMNAKDDLSDIPNTTLFEGKIVEIKQLDNGQAEITLDKPLKSAVAKGTKVRVHGTTGSYPYTHIVKSLKAGEEQILNSTIKKDDQFLEYSSKTLSRGVYYVVPLILSYSDDATKENTIQISDYSISY